MSTAVDREGLRRLTARKTRERYGLTSRNVEAKLEQWLGGESVDSMKLCGSGLGIPIPIMGVPAYLMPGGGFMPRIAGGAGFASLSDLISEATTGGKLQQLIYNKTGVAAPAATASHQLWSAGVVPSAGASPAAPAGGTVPTRASTGALGQQNPTGGDTLHMTTWIGAGTAVGSLMLYDYLFGALTAANPGVGSIAVTGVQNRYTGAAGTPEYAAGNFISNWVAVILAATAHNITYTYADQDNNAGASSGAMAGRSAAIALSTDLTQPRWCADFAAGDQGARQITAIQFSASPATGQVAHYIGHPLAILPMPAINIGFVLDGINSAFNLAKVMDNAALTLMEFFKSATGAATYSGKITLVSG